ncbi:DUF6246 family protein [Orbus mooreae]|uniref:DUF6246 family protein n=1 Tax=Orbus mooreae TaxID=3074107 RepID=UPI00370D46F9
MIRVDIGEILIIQKTKGFIGEKAKAFKLTPSFENIAKIGDSEQIINIYSTLINNKHIQLLKSFNKNMNKVIVHEIKACIKKQVECANLVISCCSNEDISKLKITHDTRINIATSLMRYGVSGRANVRVSQRNESKNYQSKFDIDQYINNARVHLGLPLDEAKKLTMTEYILLMANKFPDNESMTSKDYDEVMDEYKKHKAERLKQAARG